MQKFRGADAVINDVVRAMAKSLRCGAKIFIELMRKLILKRRRTPWHELQNPNGATNKIRSV